MTQEPALADLPSALEVENYLQQHPDFFHNRDDLLLELYVPHAPVGAVSLVERQIQVLRQRNNLLTQHLSHLMDVARDNDRLFERTRRLVLDLLETQTLEEVVTVVDESLRHHFQIPYTSLVLFTQESLPVGRSVRLDEAWDHIGSLLTEPTAVCGLLQPHELDFLFGDDSLLIGSAAVVRIGNYGLLAIGTPDPDHYKSSLGTLFLGHVADVLARMLARFAPLLESFD